MSGQQTADPVFYMTPNSTRDMAISFRNVLTGSERLTGTPTLAISAGGPTLSSPAVNAATLKIETPDDPHYALAGQAVTFRATASGTAAATYTVTVTCGTVGGQSIQGYATIVVQTS
jgi:hypothetical protein